MRPAALAGKVALISGAARGQGLAEVERFRAEGASVVAAMSWSTTGSTWT